MWLWLVQPVYINVFNSETRGLEIMECSPMKIPQNEPPAVNVNAVKFSKWNCAVNLNTSLFFSEGKLFGGGEGGGDYFPL